MLPRDGVPPCPVTVTGWVSGYGVSLGTRSVLTALPDRCASWSACALARRVRSRALITYITLHGKPDTHTLHHAGHALSRSAGGIKGHASLAQDDQEPVTDNSMVADRGQQDPADEPETEQEQGAGVFGSLR